MFSLIYTFLQRNCLHMRTSPGRIDTSRIGSRQLLSLKRCEEPGKKVRTRRLFRILESVLPRVLARTQGYRKTNFNLELRRRSPPLHLNGLHFAVHKATLQCSRASVWAVTVPRVQLRVATRQHCYAQPLIIVVAISMHTGSSYP